MSLGRIRYISLQSLSITRSFLPRSIRTCLSYTARTRQHCQGQRIGTSRVEALAHVLTDEEKALFPILRRIILDAVNNSHKNGLDRQQSKPIDAAGEAVADKARGYVVLTVMLLLLYQLGKRAISKFRSLPVPKEAVITNSPAAVNINHSTNALAKMIRTAAMFALVSRLLWVV